MYVILKQLFPKKQLLIFQKGILRAKGLKSCWVVWYALTGVSHEYKAQGLKLKAESSKPSEPNEPNKPNKPNSSFQYRRQ